MKRRVHAVAGLVLMGAIGLQPAHAVTPSAQLPVGQTFAQMWEKYGQNFHQELAPPGQTPQQRIDWVTNELRAAGRTPSEWTALAKSLPSLATNGNAVAVSIKHDLAREVIALDTLVAGKISKGDRATITARAAALDPSVAVPLADLVATVRRAYAVQQPIAATVVARVKAIRNYDGTPVLMPTERDVMLVNQAAIIAAIGTFKTHTAAHRSAFNVSGRTFADPLGLVILGGSGNDVYNRNPSMFPDPVLLVDPDGSDQYYNSAGGACPAAVGDMMVCNQLVVSVLADLGNTSDDIYAYDGPPAPVQGAGGIGALGVLVDVGGSDTYRSTMRRETATKLPLLYFDGGSQGFGYGGVGAIIDAAGNDLYDAQVTTDTDGFTALESQGFGGGGGVGVSVDAQGDDQWIAEGLGQGGVGGFQGMYDDGTGFYGGVGVLEDMAGNDRYRSTVTSLATDYYAQGFGAFGGVGIFDEGAGDDSYFTGENATGPATYVINPTLNCAYGTASFAGVGVMTDRGGNDTYQGDTKSTGGAWVMDWGWGGPGAAYGVFADLSGNDVYSETAESGPGYPIYRGGFGYLDVGDVTNPLSVPFHNTFGAFADTGGADIYAGPYDDEINNNSTWAFGVDLG